MADNNKIREEVQALTERLETGIQDLYASDKYAAYLDTLARFHNYSTRNTMLIHLQMPEATQVAGFNKWKNEFERHVMKGQKGIRIFAPSPYKIRKEMEKLDPDTQAPLLDRDGRPVTEEVDITIPSFKAISVFDVSQTDGKPLPSLAENLTGDVQQYDAFLDALRDVSVMPIGFEALNPDTDGECRLENRTIAIREGMSEVQTVSAVLHEMTHAELHDYNAELEQQENDVDADGLEDSENADAAPKPRNRRAEEVEAESVSYVVCQHYGIETGDNSFGYVAEWSKDKELAELKASLDIIRKTAASMIERIDSRFSEICKERGIDLSPVQEEQEPTLDAPAPENAVVAPEPEQPAPPATQRKYYITDRQREQAERMAAKWEARAEAFYAGGDGWGFDVVGYCKTPEEAEKATNHADKIHDSINALLSGNGQWSDVKVIQQAVSIRDDLDAQIAAIQDERNQETPVSEPEVTQEQTPDSEKQPENEGATSRYTSFQQKGFELAQQYEKLPLQDKLNLIASTFGCKTAHIETSPCTGKWRGTSDISIVFDNGSSLAVGNERTPKAKTAKAQNECVNSALARYHPEIVNECKALATAAMMKHEATDNAIAAQKGLKPYTFLNVELDDGQDELSGSHMGWYYVTLAVDGKIVPFIETGLNYGIVDGTLSERASRENYFVAGALKDADVDFVVNNVGHSSTKELYTVPLTDAARERAEQTLSVRLAPDVADGQAEPQLTPAQEKAAPEQDAGDIFPDPAIGLSERDLYGYTYPTMLPMLQERALELFDQDLSVYLLYQDGTEAAAFERDEIENHDGIFGIEAEDWQTSKDYELVKAAAQERDAPTYDKDATYEIYQLKDGETTRDYRWEALENLEARGLAVDRDNYSLVYSAPLADGTTLDGIYRQFNTDHPADFTGHSLSMSDIIVLQQDGVCTAHYIDRAEIVELPDFFREKQPELAATEVERWENDHIADISVSTPPTPTPEYTGPSVAELKEQVDVGEQISLLDLARASHNEKPAQVTRRKGEKPSILAQLREAQKEAAQGQGQQKSAPKRDSEREV